VARRLRGARRWYLAAAAATLFGVFVPLPAVGTAAPNAIVLENQQPGTTSWKFTDFNKAEHHEIEGYASLTSVNKGGSIDFMVSLSSSAQYTMDVYRMGWYPTGTNPDGSSCAPSCGGRLMQHVGPLQGSTQAACTRDSSSSSNDFGLTECNWTPSYTLNVPTSWTTGNYIVKLKRLDGAQLENWMTFVVRDDSSTAPVVYSMDVNTWQAYNFWGGAGNANLGINLYGRFNDVTLGTASGSRAYTVSFNRPYLVQGSTDGAGNFMVWDFPMVKWMESQGYDMTYITDVDLETNPNVLTGHRVFVNTGHDEYYSDTMRNRIQNAIDTGVNMAFFSANNIYFRVTWDADAAGRPNRRIHCDKGALTGLATVEYRNLATPRPENALLGVLQNGVATDRPFLVNDASHWIFQGSGLSTYTGNGTSGVITSGAGQNALAGIVGYEFDERAVNASSLSQYASFDPPGIQQVGHSFVPAGDNGVQAWSDAVLYTAGSGAIVFSAGTIQWSYTVDNGYADGFCDCAHNVANAAGQRVTSNILNRLSAPATPTGIVSLSSTSLTYPSQVIGTTSAAQTVTVTNVGTAPLEIDSIALTGANPGDYAQTNTCPIKPATLAVNATCTVSATFTPTAAGSRTAGVTLTDDAPNGQQAIILSGTGATPTPGATLTPTSLPFGSQAVNTTSAPQTVTLRNSGTGPLTISTIGLVGTNAAHYAQTNDCPISPATLAVNATCTATVTFKPTATGTRNATLRFTDNAGSGTQNVSLTGSGVTSALTFTPTSLTFAGQAVGTTSASQTSTVRNVSAAAVTISAIALTGTNAGDYGQTNTCPGSLAANATCTVTVTFTPTASGTRTASLQVTDSGTGSPHTLALTGTGTTAGGITLAPTSLGFGSQRVGTTAAAQTISVTSSGSAPLSISAIAVTGTNAGDFAQTNNCPIAPATLAVNSSCTVSVTFTPSATGSRSASMSITDNAAGSPQTAAVTGTGTAPAVTLTPASLTFAGQTVGTTSPSQGATLRNSGTAPLAISAIVVAGTNAADFAQLNDCPLSPTTLAVNATCTINVTFAPGGSGPRSAAVTISDDASGSPQSLGLSGTGLAAAPGVGLAPTSLDFAARAVGSTSAAQSTTLTNTGNAALTISSIGITGTNAADFAQTSTCPTSPSTLAAGASCSISVTFTPSAGGARTAAVSVTDDASGSPQTVALTGTGQAPAVTLTPTSLPFGPQLLGTTSAAQSSTLRNSGAAPLTITSIAVTGTNAGDFAQTNDCPLAPLTLAANATCTISATFSPSDASPRSASVSIADNAAGSPHSVSLSGTGTQPAPAVTLTPSLSFGSQRVGTTSAAQQATLTNSGTAPLAISSIGVTGTNAAEYAQTNTCPASPSTLAAGASCTISVTFSPSATGSRTASVSVADNAAGSPHTVTLSGTGTQPAVTLTPASLTFGGQTLGTTSAAQTVTVTNSGTAPLAISSILLGGTNAGDFAQTNTCPTVPSLLAANASCTVSVTFTPPATGTRSATVTINDDAPANPHGIPLTGTGAAAGAIALDKNLGTKTDNLASTSMTLTTTAAATAGSRVFVFVDWTQSTRTLTSVTGGGLTWTVDVQAKATNSNIRQAIASAPAPSGLPTNTVITATFSGSVVHGLISGVSFTGIASATPVDVTANATQGGVTAWSCTLTTTNPNDLVLGWSTIDANATSTPTAPSTELHDFGDINYYGWATSVYRTETTTGAKTLNGTWSNNNLSTSNITVCAAYKAG
jgi:hypothetical protein